MNMPEPLAQPASHDRSEEILVLVRSAFAEKGFDGASMRDTVSMNLSTDQARPDVAVS